MNFNHISKRLYVYSDTDNNITYEAKKVLKTINNESCQIMFMKEHYIPDACDEIGPYHHIWTFYIFIRNLNGEIQHLRFYREYNDKFEKSRNHPYVKVNFTDFDFKLIENIIKFEQEPFK